MPDHTPGPWVVQESEHPDVGLLIKPVPGQVVAECDRLPEMEANARLIASAPDMLDILIQIRLASEFGDITSLNYAIRQAGKIIDKATGEE